MIKEKWLALMLGTGKAPAPRTTVEAPAPRHYKNITDITIHARDVNNNFFTPDAMRFFRATVMTKTYGKYGNVFITSEKLVSPYHPDEPRKYTVRYIDPLTGDIDTLSVFQQFATLAEARRYAEKIGAIEL